MDEKEKDRAREEQVAEIAKAMERYKEESGRKFPTWREVFTVIQELGYQKVGRSG